MCLSSIWPTKSGMPGWIRSILRSGWRKVMIGAEKDQVKTYAVAKSSGYCDMEKLCELISNRSAMSSADVKVMVTEGSGGGEEERPGEL